MQPAVVNAEWRTREMYNLFGQTGHGNLNRMLHVTKYLMGGRGFGERGRGLGAESVHRETDLEGQ